MTAGDTAGTVEHTAVSERAAIWLWLSIAAAVLALAGSVIGLTVDSIYADLTSAFLPQALAQDIANLALAAPAMLICGILALRGSLRAYLVWLGVVTFTVYNYVIYTFSIPFGPLFPLWVAVLGLCIYALIGGFAAIDRDAVAAWFLIVVAMLFSLLWLSEDVPALLAGDTPQSVIDMAFPTNPVHVLDLAFFLPAVVVTGVLLLKHRPFAYAAAPALVVFLILTGVPILFTPFVQAAHGEAAGWGVMVPIGALTVALLGVLTWLLSTVRADERPSAESDRPS